MTRIVAERDGPSDGDVANQNTVDAYIEHEYSVSQSLRAPKNIIKAIAKAMIRNKADSYCQAWDVMTAGISALVSDLKGLYGGFGTYTPTRPGTLVLASSSSGPNRGGGHGNSIVRMWQAFLDRVRSTRNAVRTQRGAPPKSGPQRR